jgi:hypothetical protein
VGKFFNENGIPEGDASISHRKGQSHLSCVVKDESVTVLLAR